MKKKLISTPFQQGISRNCRFFRHFFYILSLLIIGNAGIATAQAPPKFTVSFKDASLIDIFNYFEKNSDYTFVYNSTNVKNHSGTITGSFQVASLHQILTKCLEKTHLDFDITDKHVMIKNRTTPPTMYKLSGKVVNTHGHGIPGVTVLIDGTKIGVASDNNGDFAINVPFEKGVLSFSFIGYKPQKVNVSYGKKITVTLEEDVADLDEVTIVAYGERKKRELISAVSSVKADDIKEIPTANFISLLQGRMAGVEITNQSGAPGGGGTIVAIRGYNSLFDNKSKSSDGTPLYVIDGVPMHAYTSPVTGTNALAELDPSTIESIEVLKDAASAAIYGSRAGNGVILITTKKGQKGDARFSANISYSTSQLPESPLQLGGNMERQYQLRALRSMRKAVYEENTGLYEYPTSYEEAKKGGAQYDYFWNGGNKPKLARWLQDSINPFYNNSTNWFRKVFRLGRVLNANMQASGGAQRFQYMLGAGYYQESGIMYGSDFARVNLISNTTIYPVKNLRIDNRIYLAYSDRSRGPGANSLVKAQKIETLTADPKSTSSLLPPGGEVADELLKKLNSTVAKQDDYRLRTNLVLDYKFWKGLSASVSGAVDYGQSNSNVFEPSFLDAELSMNKSTGYISRNIMLQNENMLKYNVSICNRHNIDVLLGISVTKNQFYENIGFGRGSGSNLIYYVGKVQADVYNREGSDWISLLYYRSSFQENVMLSYYGRIAYNYKKRYLLEATLRRDGSSVFGEHKRYATFPSVAVGWAFSDEKFMRDLDWLSYGKIRASWGTSGQVFGADYLAHGLISKGSIFNGKQGMSSAGVINQNLTWEESDQYDLGLDMDFLNYRLKFKLDYYYKYTKGLLYEVKLPGNVYGSDKQDQNAMEVSNEELELELQADILRESQVTWRTRFNISRNWNRFEKSYLGMDVGSLVIGKPLNGLYLWEDNGFYTSREQIPLYYQENGTQALLTTSASNEPFAPGHRKIRDLDGNGIIDSNDKYYAGSTYPVATGGWANEIRWKDFDLNLLFTYSLGRKIVRLYGLNLMNGDPMGSSPLFEDIRGKKFADGTSSDADYPMSGFYSSNPHYTALLKSNMENVSWCKLKQFTLGYNLKKDLVRKLNLVGIRLFITGENLFTWTNYSGIDPEVVNIKTGIDNFSAYPLSRKWTFGLTVNF